MPSPLTPSAKPSPSSHNWGPERILFEDEWLIAVDKPAGLPSDRTLDPARASLLSELEAYLTRREGKKPYLALHHRLDRDTSGVILLTKHPKANAGTGALFAQKLAQKSYRALALAPTTATPVPETWEVRNYLGAAGKSGKATRYGAVRSGGDPAHTDFRLLERLPGCLLVEALPRTGRTHQIRVHLSEGGAPILGDEFYGGPLAVKLPSGKRLAIPRLLLHAAALEFKHPMTQETLQLSCSLPADFQGCLDALRGA